MLFRSIHSDGSRTPDPPPKTISFFLHADGTEVTPTLFISLAGIGGYGYLGGTRLSDILLDKLRAMWLLPGDLDTDPKLANKVTVEKPVTPQTTQMAPRRQQERRLGALARGGRLSLIARLPASPLLNDSDPGSPEKQTVAAFLDRLELHEPYLVHKWRDGVLLLNYARWFEEDLPGSRLPWKLIKKLQAATRAQNGFLSLADLAGLARLLNDQQLDRLASDFPIARAVKSYRALFLAYDRSEEIARALTSDRGIPIEALYPNRESLPESHLKRLLAYEQAFAVRLVVRDVPESKPPTRSVAVYVVNKAGKPIAGVGLNIKKLTFPEITGTSETTGAAATRKP